MLSRIPYELRVAVTGHRAIPDEPAVARAIEDVLDRITSTLIDGDATPLAWTIVSPLARGADQLAANTLLERVGARLEVVSPFPLAEYRKDFSSDGELAQFEALLARAAAVDELPCAGQTVEVPCGDGETLKALRDAAYLRAGERVVETSEILLAIWNGRQAAGTGGTAEIVEYALERDRVVLWINAEHPAEPPRRIRGVRYAGNPSGHPAIVTSEDFPLTLKQLSRGYGQQLAYFRDPALAPEDYRGEMQRTRTHLSSAAAQAGLPATALDGILALIVPQFARADALALLYHRKHARGVSGVLYLAALAVTIAVGQVLFFPARLWLILFEVAAMLTVLGLWASAGSSGWHEKWLHARYLAEQLRIAMFTTLLEPESRKERGDPLPFYRGPQQWLMQTVHTIVSEAGSTVPPLPLDALKAFLIQAWLEDQRKFHERGAERKAHSAHRRHWIGFALFGATLLMALLHLAGVGHHSLSAEPPILSPGVWITFLALVLPAWAGAVHAVTSQLELERIAERSHRMAMALEWLAHRATRAVSLDELRETVNETAELMMVENHEWWILLSFQGARLHV
jgi:hypothetical protein